MPKPFSPALFSGGRNSHNRLRKRPSRLRAFSLIELLVVLAIVVILAVTLTSRVTGSRLRTDRELCRKNLQEIYLTLSIYAADNRSLYPALAQADISAAPLSLLVPRSTTETAMFICPASDDHALPEGEAFARRRVSYSYYMGRATNAPPNSALASDWQVNTKAKAAGQPVFSANGQEPGNNHGKEGGNILLDNGVVEFSPPLAGRDLPLEPGVLLLNPVP